MEGFRVDESGYTGFDLLNHEQRFQGASAIAISNSCLDLPPINYASISPSHRKMDPKHSPGWCTVSGWGLHLAGRHPVVRQQLGDLAGLLRR